MKGVNHHNIFITICCRPILTPPARKFLSPKRFLFTMRKH
jgi:hypothetical protein